MIGRKSLLFFISLLFLLAGCRVSMDESVQQQVEDAYMSEQGLIHAYPNQEDSQYLSESVGLYLEFLLQVEDKDRFAEQVALLQDYFVQTSDGASFIAWELTDNTQVNALIDDVRIIKVLKEASDTFSEPAYDELAEDLLMVIKQTQIWKDVFVDYYDWEYQTTANRITLSYLIPAFFQFFPEAAANRLILENASGDPVFYPEYFELSTQTYQFDGEAHMVDQLLIALNKEQVNMAFEDWIIKEWEREDRLYGRYDKETLESTVEYESLAVYGYLHRFFMKIGDEDLAEEVFQRAEVLAQESAGQLHFFDFIHWELMKKRG
ncbi:MULTISPECIES: hypothetical protein [Gracilibacillus]|uniref:hypothetical protein n=1 Tax=Gracilibacillus TaxID=74385 RepID=UPI000824CAE2|nr:MULTISPECIES: hypothetical protein [Gracilibacillus]